MRRKAGKQRAERCLGNLELGICLKSGAVPVLRFFGLAALGLGLHHARRHAHPFMVGMIDAQ